MKRKSIRVEVTATSDNTKVGQLVRRLAVLVVRETYALPRRSNVAQQRVLPRSPVAASVSSVPAPPVEH